MTMQVKSQSATSWQGDVDLLTYAAKCMLLCSVLLGAVAFSVGKMVWDGQLMDTDSYMRLLQVRDLYYNAEWYEKFTARSNAPFGHSMHWTRPLDLLLLGPAWIATQFGIPFDRALHLWGSAISPLLYILAVLMMGLGVRTLLPQKRQWEFAAFLLALSLAPAVYSGFGRPDHHALVLLLAVLSMATAIAMLVQPFAWRLACLSGILHGIGIWVAPEGLIILAPAILALAFAWLREGTESAKKAVLFSFALFACLGIAIVAERPPAQFFLIEYDRISVPHFGMAGLLAIGWGAFYLAHPLLSKFWSRALLGSVYGGVSLALLLWLFPGFLAGPVGQVGGRLQSEWLMHVKEMQSAFPNSFDNASSFFFYLGCSLSGLIYSPFLLRRFAHSPLLPAILYGVIGLALTFMLGLLHIRMSVHTAIFAALLNTFLIAAIQARLKGLKEALAVVSIMVFGPLAGIGFSAADPKGNVQTVSIARAPCNQTALIRYLNNRPDAESQPVILTSTDHFGPTILYFTPFRVVASPYHRNDQGLLAMIDVFRAEDDSEAFKIIQSHGADLLLTCASARPVIFGLPSQPPVQLIDRLADGQIPDWLRPVELTPDLAGFSLYEVIK